MEVENEGKIDDLRIKFQQLYSFLKTELLQDPAFKHDYISHQWVDQMLDYNVPGGKLNRGLSVVESYMFLREGERFPENDIFLTSVLGWCIQWLVGCVLVLDDIMDNSHTRRGQTCWFRLPKVGMISVNDGVLLWNYINRILRKHFRDQSYYADLLDLFNEVEFQTASGEMMDLITTLEGEKDLSKYTPALQRRAPSAGEKLDDYIDAKDILLEMGIYFQVQDDYLDCFGDPDKVGKIGTDIEDFKCSWLVVKALEDNYGKADPAKVAIVKSLYQDLNLQGIYVEYENDVYEKLSACIKALPSKSVQAVLRSYLGKVYKRQK